MAYVLSVAGLGGNTAVIEIGGPSYLLPVVQREKIYDIKNVPQLVGDKESFVIGAGAGPWPFFGVNSEVSMARACFCVCVLTIELS